MSKNNNIIDYKNMQIPNPDDEDYFPKLLNIRINFRKSVQYFSIYIFFLFIFYFIFGTYFFDATYMTRNFIFDPDKFWLHNMKKPFLLKLQKFCAAAGMYLICATSFSIMDNIVIYLLIINGGLKRKLQYANYIFFFLQIFSFIFCLYGIIVYKNILILFPLIFAFSLFSLIAAIIYFIIIRRSLSCENLFLLSIERMINQKNKYKKEYYIQFNIYLLLQISLLFI